MLSCSGCTAGLLRFDVLKILNTYMPLSHFIDEIWFTLSRHFQYLSWLVSLVFLKESLHPKPCYKNHWGKKKKGSSIRLRLTKGHLFKFKSRWSLAMLTNKAAHESFSKLLTGTLLWTTRHRQFKFCHYACLQMLSFWSSQTAASYFQPKSILHLDHPAPDLSGGLNKLTLLMGIIQRRVCGVLALCISY